MTLRQLARAAGTSASRLSDYENAKVAPTTDVLARLSHVAGTVAPPAIPICLMAADDRDHRALGLDYFRRATRPTSRKSRLMLRRLLASNLPPQLGHEAVALGDHVVLVNRLQVLLAR